MGLPRKPPGKCDSPKDDLPRQLRRPFQSPPVAQDPFQSEIGPNSSASQAQASLGAQSGTLAGPAATSQVSTATFGPLPFDEEEYSLNQTGHTLTRKGSQAAENDLTDCEQSFIDDPLNKAFSEENNEDDSRLDEASNGTAKNIELPSRLKYIINPENLPNQPHSSTISFPPLSQSFMPASSRQAAAEAEERRRRIAERATLYDRQREVEAEAKKNQHAAAALLHQQRELAELKAKLEQSNRNHSNQPASQPAASSNREDEVSALNALHDQRHAANAEERRSLVAANDSLQKQLRAMEKRVDLLNWQENTVNEEEEFSDIAGPEVHRKVNRKSTGDTYKTPPQAKQVVPPRDQRCSGGASQNFSDNNYPPPSASVRQSFNQKEVLKNYAYNGEANVENYLARIVRRLELYMVDMVYWPRMVHSTLSTVAEGQLNLTADNHGVSLTRCSWDQFRELKVKTFRTKTSTRTVIHLIANTKQDAEETVQSYIDRQIKIYQDHDPYRANLSEQVAGNAIIKGFMSRVQKNIDQRSLDIMSIVELREVAQKAEVYVNKYTQRSPKASDQPEDCEDVLLGVDFFRKFKLEVDFEDRRIRCKVTNRNWYMTDKNIRQQDGKMEKSMVIGRFIRVDEPTGRQAIEDVYKESVAKSKSPVSPGHAGYK
ncbi:hypothetical protein HDE_00163 [Halotydeus destructor]|nr:hypothetical protein HDE_00163 [Halotydeus destructor]